MSSSERGPYNHPPTISFEEPRREGLEISGTCISTSFTRSSMRFSSACKYLFMRISGCRVVDVDCSGKLIIIYLGMKQRINRTIVSEIESQGCRVRIRVGIR